MSHSLGPSTLTRRGEETRSMLPSNPLAATGDVLLAAMNQGARPQGGGNRERGTVDEKPIQIAKGPFRG